MSKIKKTKEFSGTVEKKDGQAKITLDAPDFYRSEINQFDDGEKVKMMITNEKEKRTNAQNRYYWGAYMPLLEKAGSGNDDKEDLHEMFKEAYLFTGIKTVYNLITKKNEEQKKYKSTTQLDKNEFSDFIRKIERDTGVLAPPTENYGLPPLEMYDIHNEGLAFNERS